MRWAVGWALAPVAFAALIAVAVLVGAHDGSGPLVQPHHRPADVAPASACIPTSTTGADGRTWHGCR